MMGNFGNFSSDINANIKNIQKPNLTQQTFTIEQYFIPRPLLVSLRVSETGLRE